MDAHGCTTFSSINDLKFKVVADVASQLRPGREFPLFLPSLCDRTEVLEEIERRIGASHANNHKKLLVCAVRGDDTQEVDLFEERLLDYHLAERLRIDYLPVECRITWPRSINQENFSKTLHDAVCRELDLDWNASVFDVDIELHKFRLPVVITVDVDTSRWSNRTPALIKAFLDYWESYPIKSRDHPIMVLMVMRYPSRRSWLNFFGSGEGIARKIEADLSAAPGQRLCVLDELSDVGLAEVREWAKSSPIREAFPNATDEGKRTGEESANHVRH